MRCAAARNTLTPSDSSPPCPEQGTMPLILCLSSCRNHTARGRCCAAPTAPAGSSCLAALALLYGVHPAKSPPQHHRRQRASTRNAQFILVLSNLETLQVAHLCSRVCQWPQVCSSPATQHHSCRTKRNTAQRMTAQTQQHKTAVDVLLKPCNQANLRLVSVMVPALVRSICEWDDTPATMRVCPHPCCTAPATIGIISNLVCP